jgi:membrane-bound lytic murein transglycosylase D
MKRIRAIVLAFGGLALGQAGWGQVLPKAQAQTATETTADSAAHFDVMFLAEPSDTLVIMQEPGYEVFSERDSVPTFTDAEATDTLDFKSYIPETPPDLVEDRLSCLQQEIPLTYNRTVNSFINFFVVRKRNYTQTMLERKDFYFPLFEETLKKYGLPDELKYLSIVESGLNMRAVSRSGAVGLWQFMGATGSGLRLYQDKYKDERMDPQKATEAACKYLRSLYNQFNDWELALAAYNCGPGAIRRTLARTGGRTFWEIYNALPAETRSYVPQFTAVIYAMNYAPYHNLYPDADSLFRLPPADTVVLERQLDFAALSRHLQIDPKELLHLNPVIRRGVSPENGSFVLRLPAEAAARFKAERQCFMDSCVGQPLPDAPARRTRISTKEGDANAVVMVRKTHKVRPGQTLFAVARQYDVTVGELRHWNHIRSTRLHKGQKLLVYVATKAAAAKNRASEETATSFTNQVVASKTAPSEASTDAQQTKPQPDSAFLSLISEKKEAIQKAIAEEEEREMPKVLGPKGKHQKERLNVAKNATKKELKNLPRTHHVEPGDTLWNIARRYEGLTVQRLMKLNGLKDKTLKVGQTLIVG